MKKEVKGIIALGGVLAVLGGGLAVMKLTDKSGSESSDSTDTPTVETTTAPSGSGIVIVGDGEENHEGLVKKLHVKNSEDEFNIIMKNHLKKK